MKPLLIAVVGILLVIRIGSAAELRVLASTRMDGAIESHSPAGRRLLPARELLVQGASRDKRIRGNLMVVFDQSSGYFLSCLFADVFPRELENDEARLRIHKHSLLLVVQHHQVEIYADRERLVAFRFSGARISFLDATGKAVSLDDAENRAVQAATIAVAELDRSMWYGWKPVELPKPFERDFLLRKYTAAAGGAYFEYVTWQDQKWHLVLKGAGEGKTKITLNDKREVLEMEWVK